MADQPTREKLKVMAWAVLDNRGRLDYEMGELPRYRIFKSRLEADTFIREKGDIKSMTPVLVDVIEVEKCHISEQNQPAAARGTRTAELAPEQSGGSWHPSGSG